MTEPQTAREALLEMRLRIAMISRFDSDTGAFLQGLYDVAEAGLSCSGMANFELVDQLADRLAEAHKLLRELGEVQLTPEDDSELVARIPMVLSLPPDLDTMVERRIGHT